MYRVIYYVIGWCMLSWLLLRDIHILNSCSCDFQFCIRISELETDVQNMLNDAGQHVAVDDELSSDLNTIMKIGTNIYFYFCSDD